MEYHQDRFEDFSLMVFKKDKLIAILPANKIKNGVYSHQGLTFSGLIKFLNHHQIKSLRIKQIPLIYTILSITEMTHQMVVSIPISPVMTDEEVSKVINVINLY
ncbi:hypothetical protein ACS386_10325 [Flavobacteriaceae bacterium LMO-SS05]